MAWEPKRDLEYVSKVEKAIEQRYGEGATINPRSLWNEEKEKDYIEQVRENAEKYYQIDDEGDMVEQDGVLLSKKLITKSNTSSCPICAKYMLDTRDAAYILKWSACFSCYIDHIDGREERWASGWRPERKNK